MTEFSSHLNSYLLFTLVSIQNFFFMYLSKFLVYRLNASVVVFSYYFKNFEHIYLSELQKFAFKGAILEVFYF